MSQVLSIGHRGAAGHAPENTLAAIRCGIDYGVDFIEIDVRSTQDGILVALHDESVERTHNRSGRIDRLSFRDVQGFTTRMGEHIPTVREVLAVAAEFGTGLMLELKAKGLARSILDEVRKAEFAWPVFYASFLHDELTEVRMIDPDAAIMPLFDRVPHGLIDRARRYKATHVGMKHTKVGRELVQDVHRADMLIWVYTVNRPRDIQRMLSIGVDGVISDFPERLQQKAS